MSLSNIEQHIASARDALQGFLGTLMGGDVTLEVAAPTSTSLEAVQAEERPLLTIVPQSGPSFVVRLSPEWLPLLSKAMLGEAIKVGDEGYEDLARELMGQAYGAIRTQLSGAGISLGDATFDVLPPEEEVPIEALSNELSQVAFHMDGPDGKLEGLVLLPPLSMAQEQPKAAAPAAPPPGAAPPPSAPGMGAPGMAPPPGQPVPVAPLNFPDLGRETLGDGNHSFGLLADVELEVTVELGRRRLPLADILRLTNGSVIELEKLVGEPLDIYANGRFIAEGEAVVIDEQFGIRITSLASSRNRDKAFH